MSINRKSVVEIDYQGTNQIIKIIIGDVRFGVKPTVKVKELIVDINRHENASRWDSNLIIVGSLNNKPFVKSIDLSSLNFGECADFLTEIVRNTKPKKFIVSPTGIGLGVLDSIYPLFKERNIKIKKSNGKLTYL